MSIYKFCVELKDNNFIEKSGESKLAEQAKFLGFKDVDSIQAKKLYFVRGSLSEGEKEELANFLFCDELYEYCSIEELKDESKNSSLQNSDSENTHVIETALKPGVTDSASREAVRGVQELGMKNIEEITGGMAYEIKGNLNEAELKNLAENLLCNAVIEQYSLTAVSPAWTCENTPDTSVEEFDIANMSDDELIKFSNEMRSALDLKECQAIREYYKKENRLCSDAEFEMIAQTWSEHCVHKTFKAKIDIDESTLNEEQKKAYPNSCVDSVIKTYIKKATDEINAPWVLSSFVDNAGIVEFDENYEISFKAETHNHPSAIEPFGGANTGVGGVIRDIMGVSARPFAVTDVLCFGHPDTPVENLPKGSLHPKRIISGVVSGVEDYGNKMGIPTVNGGVHYHEGYATNPLVYCGCAGIAPRGKHRTTPGVGDRIISLGGKVGRDGLRGATFSSMVMDASTGSVAGSSVQIGEPIIQKKVEEVLLVARDRELYSAITDCGAGGFSSAVGEMAEELGCNVDLAQVPLKYAGLTPWEIWLSEAQERMVIAVPEKHMAELQKLCDDNDVELSNLGYFTGDGVISVFFGEKKVIKLDCSFLHSGPPQRQLNASCPKEKKLPAYPKYKESNFKDALEKLMAHHSISSKEDIVRLYDHEVQGGTILRPYDGKNGDAPQDAAVVVPMETQDKKKAVALSNGLNPRYAIIDPYKAAVSAIDEAVRNAVAVGADPDKIAILDNFCLGDPKNPEVVWTLIEMARACYETAIQFKTPFISGKDSFNNEYLSNSGERVSIPPSLLISAMGIVPDIAKVPGSDFKAKGSNIYLVGKPDFSFVGSVFAELFGLPEAENSKLSNAQSIPAFSSDAVELYKKLHKAISAGTVSACHDLSDGGMAVALEEMTLSGVSYELNANLEEVLNCDKLTYSFAETNSCFVVEVAQEHAKTFEELMDKDLIYNIGKTL